MAAEEVLYHIIGNSQFSNTNVDDISTIVKEYPFFSPAQFLLALKQKKDNSYNYQYQLQKASLYFSNQVWLNYLLNEREVAEPDLNIVEAEKIVEPSVETKQENIFPTSIIGSTSYISPLEEADAISTTTAEHTDEIIGEASTTEDDFFDYSSLFTNKSDIEVPTLESVKELLGKKSDANSESDIPKFPSILKEPIATVVLQTRIPSFSFTPKEESEAKNNEEEVKENHEQNAPFSIDFSSPTINFATEKAEETIEFNHPAVDKTIEHEIAPAVEPAKDNIPSYSFKGFSDAVHNTVEEHLSDAVSISEAYAQQHIEEEGGEEDVDNSPYANNVSSIISNQLEGFKKPVEANSKFEFENESKLHTIDYFASQGIKIDLTKIPQDKLTVQMRRFTDWLKQIKKTDPNPQDLGTDPELEKAIENIAKTSIEAKEIVTETMADVFVKQGKVNKAIQLYIKLSFLDPSKSTYFANKIQQLKGI